MEQVCVDGSRRLESGDGLNSLARYRAPYDPFRSLKLGCRLFSASRRVTYGLIFPQQLGLIKRVCGLGAGGTVLTRLSPVSTLSRLLPSSALHQPVGNTHSLIYYRLG